MVAGSLPVPAEVPETCKREIRYQKGRGDCKGKKARVNTRSETCTIFKKYRGARRREPLLRELVRRVFLQREEGEGVLPGGE